MEIQTFETRIFDTFSYCVWSWEVPYGCEMQQSDKSKLKWFRFVTGLLQHLISATVPIACVGLNIGGGHPLQRTSKEKRVEEIKYSICTQNTPAMS